LYALNIQRNVNIFSNQFNCSFAQDPLTGPPAQQNNSSLMTEFANWISKHTWSNNRKESEVHRRLDGVLQLAGWNLTDCKLYRGVREYCCSIENCQQENWYDLFEWHCASDKYLYSFNGTVPVTSTYIRLMALCQWQTCTSV